MNKWKIILKENKKVGNIWVVEKLVPPGGHMLPELPYAYNALEPYISEEIMKLHHDKHHRSYVDGLNKAELNLKKARDNNDFSLIKHWSREISFSWFRALSSYDFLEKHEPEWRWKPSGLLKGK